jgi:hypothetical protein
LKAGQSHFAGFESRPEPTRRFWKAARANSPILKAGQSQLSDFKKPARIYLAGFQKLFANSKAFRKFKSFCALNGKEFINSV